jgi:hypothetical protein
VPGIHWNPQGIQWILRIWGDGFLWDVAKYQCINLDDVPWLFLEMFGDQRWSYDTTIGMTMGSCRSVIPWQETIFLPSGVLVGCLGKYAYVLGNIFRDIPIQPELAFATGYWMAMCLDMGNIILGFDNRKICFAFPWFFWGCVHPICNFQQNAISNRMAQKMIQKMLTCNAKPRSPGRFFSREEARCPDTDVIPRPSWTRKMSHREVGHEQKSLKSLIS